MPAELAKGIIASISSFWSVGFLAVFGGLAKYLNTYRERDEKFHLGYFLIHIFIALFAGYLIGSFIPEDTPLRDGYIMAAGYSATEILSQIDLLCSDLKKRMLK